MPSSFSLKQYNAKHRGSNRYRFQGFNERIASIQIQLTQQQLRAPHHKQDEELLQASLQAASPASDTQSHFAAELQRLRDIDKSSQFTVCCQHLHTLTRTFIQLVHNKKQVIHRLLEDISSAEQPLPYLQLLSALTKDLRQELYPLFPVIIESLLNTLQPDNTEHLEHLFTTLLFILRIFTPSLVNDLPSLFRSFFSPLLRHHKWYIRKFTAETLAYLMRKINKHNRLTLYTSILDLPDTHSEQKHRERTEGIQTEAIPPHHLPAIKATSSSYSLTEYRDGVASLLFHTHKNVCHTVHSISSESLPVLFSFLHPSASASATLFSHRTQVITSLFRRLANHVRKEQATTVWAILHGQLTNTIPQYRTLLHQVSQQHQRMDMADAQTDNSLRGKSLELAGLCGIVELWVSFRHGSRISDVSLIMQLVSMTMDEWLLYAKQQTQEYQRAALALFAAFFILPQAQVYACQLQPMLTRAMTAAVPAALSPSLLLPMIQTLQQCRPLHPVLLKQTLSYISILLTMRQASQQSQRLEKEEVSVDKSSSDWLAMLMILCRDYQQYDAFYYEQQSEIDAENEEDQQHRSTSLPINLPDVIVQPLIHIVADFLLAISKLSAVQPSMTELPCVYASLQLLSFSPTNNISRYLSPSHRHSIYQSLLVNAEMKHDPGEVETEEDEQLTVHHLLTAVFLCSTTVACETLHPSHSPLINLFGSSPAEPSFHSTCSTSPLIDSLLYLGTRAVVTAHLLLSTGAAGHITDSLVGLLHQQQQHILRLLSKYPDHPAILRQVLSFIEVTQQTRQPDILCAEASAQMTTLLAPSLSHPLPAVRLLSIRILSSLPAPGLFNDPAATTEQGKSSSQPSSALLSHLLTLFSLSPSYETEKWYETELKKLELLLTCQRLSSTSVSLTCYALVGLLHVKMSSVWPSTQRCLSALMHLYGDIVWSVWYRILERSEEDTRILVSPDEKKEMLEGTIGGQQQLEQQAPEQCSAAGPSQMDESHSDVDDRENDPDEQTTDELLVEDEQNAVPFSLSAAFDSFCHVDGRATDIYTLNSLLYKTMTLEDARVFANRHAEHLSSLFLSFFYSQYTQAYPVLEDIRKAPLLPEHSLLCPSSSSLLIPNARRIAKTKLLHFLRLFNTSFASLTALHEYRVFFPHFFYRLLLHSDTEIQSLSLDCLAKYQYVFLTPYLSHLHKLIGEQTYREEMTVFHLSPPVCTLPPQYRFPLSAFIIRLLFPKLMLRTLAGKNSSTLAARRVGVLAYLAGLQHNELKELILILTSPFLAVLGAASSRTPSSESSDFYPQISNKAKTKQTKDQIQQEDAAVIAQEYSAPLPVIDSSCLFSAVYFQLHDPIPTVRQLGFLKLLEILLTQMRSILQPYLPHLLLIMLNLLNTANHRIQEYRDTMQKRQTTAAEQPTDQGTETETETQEAGQEIDMDRDTGEDVDLDVDEDALHSAVKEQAALRSVRQLVFSRFAMVLDLYHEDFFPASTNHRDSADSLDLTAYLYHFLSLTSSSITMLAGEQTQHRGGLLQALIYMSKHASLLPTLVADQPIPADSGLPPIASLLPSVFALLSSKHVAPSVVSGVLEICYNLLYRQDEANEAVQEKERERLLMQRVAETTHRELQQTSAMLDSSDEEAEADLIAAHKRHTRQLTALSEDGNADLVASRVEKKRLAALVSTAWSTHISSFLQHMHQHIHHVSSMPSTVTKEKQLPSVSPLSIPRLFSSSKTGIVPRKELEIIARVSMYAADESTAIELISLLLPFLAQERRAQKQQKPEAVQGAPRRLKMTSKDSIQFHLLTIIYECVGLLSDPSPVASFLPRHFLYLTNSSNTSLLAKIFTVMAGKVLYLQPVAPLLIGLTSISKTRIDEPDYEQIMQAYNTYLSNYLSTFSSQQHTPLVYVMLTHLYDDELGVRGQALHTLKELCTHVKQQSEPEQPGELITSMIYPAIKRGIKSNRERIRRDWLNLWSHLLSTFPVSFASFHVLHNDNPDLDFFANITHIQSHRKQKALARLLPLVSEHRITAAVAMELLIPLATHIVLESGGQGKTAVISSGHIRTQDMDDTQLAAAREDRQRRASKMRKSANNTIGSDMAVLEMSIQVIGALSSLLSWQQYYSVLVSFTKHMKNRPELQRLLVRIICSIVDHWHFQIIEQQDMNEEERATEQAQAQVGQQKKRLAGMLKAVADKQQPTELASTHTPTRDADIAMQTRAYADSTTEEEQQQDHEEADQTEELAPTAVLSSKCRTLSLRIRQSLSQRLLPHLHTILTGTNKGDSFTLVRPPVALAIVKLLQRLPRDLFNLHFPRLLTALLTQMQSKDQEARDVARRVVVDTVLIVGPSFLSATLSESAMMLNRGYQRHTLGYLVYAILQRLVEENVAVGSIDDCIDSVMSVVMNELVGEVAAEKPVDAIKRSGKEARANKALDTIEHLTQLCSFTHLKDIITPLRQVLSTATSLSVVQDLREALRRVSEGVMKNSGVETKLLLIYVYTTVKELTEDSQTGSDAYTNEGDNDHPKLSARERELRTRKTREATFSVQTLPAATLLNSQSVSSSHNHPVLLHFSLSLLHGALRTHKIQETVPGMKEMLDPYLSLLADCCLRMKGSLDAIAETEKSSVKAAARKARHHSTSISEQVLEVSLKICNYFLRFSFLPSLPAFITPFVTMLFSLLTSASTQLYPDVFKTLSIIIHHCHHYTLDNTQLAVLLSFISAELKQPTQKQTVLFTLLHSILTRKFILPQLYDIMTEVSQLMITSYTPQVQQQCAALFLLFLLDYPMTTKRVTQHLTFMIQNLSYPQPAGRMMLLSLLAQVFYRFPAAVLDLHVELCFFPLLCVLMNDEDAGCRSKTSEALHTLIGKISTDKQQIVIGWIRTWINKTEADDEKQSTGILRRSAAAQCYGMLVTMMGDKFIPHVPSLVQQMHSICQGEQERIEILKASKSQGVADKTGKRLFPDTEDGGDDSHMENDAEVDVSADVIEESSEPHVDPCASVSADSWRLLYFSLLILEKALEISVDSSKFNNTSINRSKLPGAVVQQLDSMNLLPSLVFFLLHPHSWVRSVCTRVFSLYLPASPPLSHQLMLRLFKVSCMQLTSAYLTEKMGKQVVTNLISLSRKALTMNWDMTAGEGTDIEQQSGDQQEEPSDAETSEVKPGRVDANIPPSSSSSVAHLLTLVDQNQKNKALNWEFHRLSYQVRQAGDIARLCILHFFQCFVSEFSPSVYAPYLLSIINPLFRIANQEVVSDTDAANKQQAEALLETLQQRLSPSVFLPYYQYVRNAIVAKRKERRGKRKMLAVSAPAVFARLKQAKHDRKKVARKRRMEGIKLARGVAGVGAKGIQMPKRVSLVAQQHTQAQQRKRRKLEEVDNNNNV